MKASMAGLLARLRGVESNGKTTDLADYMESLVEERKDADSQRAGPHRESLGGKKLHSRTTPLPPTLGSDISVGIGHKTHNVEYGSASTEDLAGGGEDSVSTLSQSSRNSVTSRLSEITVNTRVSRLKGQRSAMSADALREVDSILRGPGSESVDVSSEASDVLLGLAEMTLVEQEQAAAALMQDIVRSSKLLSAGMGGDAGTYKVMGTGRLPPHLAAFKSGYDKLGKTKVRLPTITSIVDNSHMPAQSVPTGKNKKAHFTASDALGPTSALKKRLTQMLPPTEDELRLADEILENSSATIKRGEIYNSITQESIRERQEAYVLAAMKDDGNTEQTDDATIDSASFVIDDEYILAGIEDDSALSDSVVGEHISSLGGEARATAIAAYKQKKLEEIKVLMILERKRAANDERRKKEVERQAAQASLAADKVLFKAGTEFKVNAEGKVPIDESSNAFFRTMEVKKREAKIKGHMIARLEAEEAEAELAAKRKAAETAQERAIQDSRPGTRGAAEESATIRRDADGNIIDNSDSDDDDDYVDDSPTPVVGGFGLKLEGAIGSLKRKQSISQVIERTESTLLKHGQVKDIMAEMKAKVGTTKADRKKEKKAAKLALQQELNAAAAAAAKVPPKLRDFFKSPIHLDMHSVPSSKVLPCGPLTDTAALLKPRELPGGPLVVGTVNYGIPLGLPLTGSGRYKPMSMDEVENFQKKLVKAPGAILIKLGLSAPLQALSPAAEGSDVFPSSPPREQKPHPFAAHLGKDLPSPPSDTAKSAARPHSEGEHAYAFKGLEDYADNKADAQKTYEQTSSTTKVIAKQILQSYSGQRTRFARYTALMDSMKSQHEQWLDGYKWAVHDDLGVDIDAQFMAKKLAERAIRLMMFYILEVQLKNAFSFLRDQTRRITNARYERAAALINRVGRGMNARTFIRNRMQKVKERLDLERANKFKRQKLENRSAMIITRAIRRHGKMRGIKHLLSLRRYATQIQRIARGKQGRARAVRARIRRDWLRDHAIKIQCAYRQRLARRRVTLYSKIQRVKSLMAEWALTREEKMRAFQLSGAANTIKRYYRASKVREKLATIIFWNRTAKAITMQRFARGYAGRKIGKKLLRIKRAKEKRVNDAAQMMQKYVRGANARKLFATMLLIQKKNRARRRMAKAKYFQDKQNMMDTANIKALGISILRKMVPFRYIRLWSRAVIIQRVYRGYRGRKAFFIRKIKTHIRKANALYFGKEKGAMNMQRIFRGFRVRRGLMRAIRLESAVKMQCFIRQYLARQKAIFHKVRRDAIMLLSRNICILVKLRKKMANKRDNKRVARQTIQIQRMWRHALKRKRINEVKTQKRVELEQSSVISSKITYILCSVQLRILMESLNREIGKPIPFIATDVNCIANGPTHSLFLSAVGPKANGKPDELLANKLDNTNWSKWLSKIKGVTAQGKQADTAPYRRQPVRMDEWLARLARGKKSKGKRTDADADDGPGRDARTPPKNSRAKTPPRRGGGPGGPPGGGGKGKRSEKGKQERPDTPITYEYCTFSLLESVLDGSIATVRGGRKTMSGTDVDMCFVKAKSDPSHKDLTYFEFIEGVEILAQQLYFDFADEIKEAHKAEERARFRLANQLHAEMQVRHEPSSSKAPKRATSAPADQAESDSEEGSDNEKEKGDDPSEKALQMLEKLQKKEAAKAQNALRAAASKDTKDALFNAKTWRAKGLVWNIGDIALTAGKGNNTGAGHVPLLKVLLVLRMFDSCREESWYIPVANWIEKESRARLGRYAKRMQNLYWQMKAGVFRTMVKLRRAEIALNAKHRKTATLIQKYARRFIHKRRVARIAQGFLIRYVPDIGREYWYNPSTKVRKITKPAVLRHLDCLSIAMPPTGLEYVIKCSNCSSNTAAINCDECEDSYCTPCYEDMHCKGSRRTHHRQKIPLCGYCKFQMACRTCLTCMTAKPPPGSPMELMTATDRGTMCDTCFSHSHNEHEIELQHASDAKKLALKKIFNESKSAYLVAHQLHLRIKTSHKYLDMVQTCEECSSRSAAWRCMDCKQVYCNRCLVGLHSMGGPFFKHKGERLPYYTPEMHQSYLQDQRTQAFQGRMVEVNRVFAERLKETKMKKILVIQSWWRMILGRRVGNAHILATRKKVRRAWRQRKAEEHIRTSFKYKLLDAIGYAPPLSSDTVEEKVLGRISVFGKQFAREYIWQNRDDFGHYKEVTKTKNKVGQTVTKVKFARKGVPRSGFTIGTLDELHKQARSGGYRLPGYVKVVAGESNFDTTCDLSTFLEPGMLVKLGPGYFKVRAVKSGNIILDRTWRWAVPKPAGHVEEAPDLNPNRLQEAETAEDAERKKCGFEPIYRLPVYADEPRRNFYKFMYWSTNYAISNPLSQMYFAAHNSLFTKVAAVGGVLENITKKLGFRESSKRWRQYVEHQESRARWARNLKNGENDIVDLSVNKKSGTSAKKPPKDRKDKSNKKSKLQQQQIAPEVSADKKSPAMASTAASAAADSTERGQMAASAAPGVAQDPKSATNAVAGSEEDEDAALAAFMNDEIDYDNLDDGDGEDGDDENVRQEGERWVASKEEAAARAEREAKLTREDLAAQAGEWEELVDPMTENVFWVHTETHEMSMFMPASLKMRILLKEETEKNAKDMADAMARMSKITGGGQAKGKALFKKKR